MAQGGTPAGGAPYTFRTRAHSVHEQFCVDTAEENRIHGRHIDAYEDYNGKYNGRSDSLDFNAQKYMIHERFPKHRPSI